MPSFSQTSKDRLDQCDKPLQDIFNFVIYYRDCTVITGHRGKEEQDQKVAEGRSHTPYPNSKHNSSPSMAVDVMPWYSQAPHVRWPQHPDKALQLLHSGEWDEHRFLDNIKTWQELFNFSGFVLGVGADMGVGMRWGGHFKSLFDSEHYEIVR